MLEPQTNKEEEFSYVSKPSNPNILFAVPRPKVTTVTTTTTPVVRGEVLEDDEGEEGGGGEEVVQKKVKIVEEYPPERPPERKTEDAYVRELENFIAPLLREALAPVYHTLGMIEQDSGKRQFYRFAGKDLSPEQRMTPIVWGCATVEEFFKKNKHLGDVIIGNLKQYINDKEMKIKLEEKKKKKKAKKILLKKETKENTDEIVKQFEAAIKKLDTNNNKLMTQFKEYLEKLEQNNLKLDKRLEQMDLLQETLINIVKPLNATENIKLLKEKIDKIIEALRILTKKIDVKAVSDDDDFNSDEDEDQTTDAIYREPGANKDRPIKMETKIKQNYDLVGVIVALTPEQKRAVQSMFPALVFNPNNLLEVENAPVWLQSQISTSVLQFLLDRQSLGALNMGAQELGYPLQDLLFSEEVNYMFAQFVSAKFAKPKSNVYAAGVHGGGEVHYRISSGAIINQQQTTWLLGCRRWFKENVYYGKREMYIYLRTPEEYRAKARRLSEKFMQKRDEIYLEFENAKKRLANKLREYGRNADASKIEKMRIQAIFTNNDPVNLYAARDRFSAYEDYSRERLDVRDAMNNYQRLANKFDDVQTAIRNALSHADIVDTRMLRVKKKN
jgi:hypothetical protein